MSVPAPSPSYNAPNWLIGRHTQTIWPALVSPKPEVSYRRERWNTDDGDFVDIDFVDGTGPSAPTLVLFHGLEGSSDSAYAKALMAYAKLQGWHGLVAHFRSCSGEVNALARAYHSGDSDHCNFVLARTKTRNPLSPVFAVGVSLGGNALLKWLGTEGSGSRLIQAAFAVSPPHDLEAGAVVLSRGLSRVYTNNFLSSLKAKSKIKADRFPGTLDIEAVLAATDFFSFDHLVTAPLHGFRSCYDYWRRSSCKQFMHNITIPTTVLNALNDPFQPAHALAVPSEVARHVFLDYPENGGHVGFLQGWPRGHQTWLCERIFNFFKQNI
jgi:uncharacterized protein